MRDRGGHRTLLLKAGVLLQSTLGCYGAFCIATASSECHATERRLESTFCMPEDLEIAPIHQSVGISRMRSSVYETSCATTFECPKTTPPRSTNRQRLEILNNGQRGLKQKARVSSQGASEVEKQGSCKTD